MKRREFLKKAGVGSAAVASVPALETLLASPAWARSRSGGNGFFFQVVSKSTTTADLMILAGCGRISASDVTGGGSFTHFTPATTTPFPIVGTGHWRAKELLHFTQLGTYGTLIAGIAEWTAVFHVLSPSTARVPVTMEVVCNIAPAGLINPGEEEGVMVTGGPQTFVQQSPPFGLTAFTAPFQRAGDGDDDEDDLRS
jgi:hypothetical protein